MQGCFNCGSTMVLCHICQIVDTCSNTCSNKCGYDDFRKLACRKCYEDRARLFEACRGGEIDVIDQLLGHIDPRRVDEKSINLLAVTCCLPLLREYPCNKPWIRDVVQRLLQAGADVDFPNDGCRALQMVLMWPEFDITIASMLLYSSKLGVNVQDQDGRTYLHWCRTIEAVQFLIDNGIDINMPDNKGETFSQHIKQERPHSDINKLFQ